MWRGACCLWILTLLIKCSEQSHFQGASVTWRPGQTYEEENKTEIFADFHIVWKRQSTQSASTFCDDSDIINGSLLGETDSSYGWDCLNGCDVRGVSFNATCTQYDEEDDWSLGSGVANFNITEDGEFEIQFSGCCWIENLVYASTAADKWSLTILGNVGTRSDTGQPNRSPVSATTPVIRFQAGCPNFVDLVLHDEDRDIVTCKSAECTQTSCTFHPYLKLTQQGDKCRLSYNAGGPGDISVAISIILEDYPRKEGLLVDGIPQNTTTPLSSVTMLFLVRVHTDTNACSQRPTWVNDTFPNGFVKVATKRFETRIDLTVHSDVTLTTVNVVGPRGVDKGPLTSQSDVDLYSTDLTFTPTDEQIGEHVICVTAKDENGKMSEQRCMILKVGDKTPCEIDNGGCDDLCVSDGASYHCTCRRQCWHLADDRRTCIPKIEVKCLTDRFSMELPQCAVGTQKMTIGYTSQSNPIPPCEANSNGTYYVSEFLYQECLTQTKSDFMEIHYMNNVRMWIDDEDNTAGSGGIKSPITRGYYYNMQLVCSFNKYANVNASFRPQDREENFVQVPGLGSFQFFFDFYYDEQFGATYSPYEYPITVTVNSDIYFGIRTIGGTGLEVFTEKCIAMTTPTPTETTISYTMIENGCIEDITIQKYTTANSMEDHFSIKAFRFEDNLNSSNIGNIYIQCSAVLCVVGEETRCEKGCIRSRKRRDGQDEILVDRQKRSVDETEVHDDSSNPNISESNLIEITVSGPFRIDVERTPSTQIVAVATPTSADDDSKPPVKNNQSEDSTGLIVIASSVGAALFILLLLIIIALVVYYHFVLKPKHKILPNTDGRDSPTRIAWTREQHKLSDNVPPMYELPKTPPPAFWDVHSLT